MKMPDSKNIYIEKSNHYVLIVKNRSGIFYEILFDKEDYENVSCYQYSARFDRSSNVLVVRCRVIINGKSTYRNIHQIIMGKHSSLVIDHINGNRLDNRRSNLRFVNQEFNCINRKTRLNQRGFYWNKINKKYQAQICVNKKNHFIGFFDCPIKAQEAYFNKFKELRGYEHPKK